MLTFLDTFLCEELTSTKRASQNSNQERGRTECGKDATAGLKERLKACSVLRRRGGMHKMQKCERNGVCVSGLILRMLLIRGEAQKPIYFSSFSFFEANFPSHREAGRIRSCSQHLFVIVSEVVATDTEKLQASQAEQGSRNRCPALCS